MCENCGRVLEDIPLSRNTDDINFPIDTPKTLKKATSRSTLRYSVRVNVGKSHRLYNIRVPIFYEELLKSDVLVTGSVDLERSFVLSRVRLNVKVLLAILYSEEIKHDAIKKDKALSFRFFLKWKQTPSSLWQAPAGRIVIVEKDGAAKVLDEEISLQPGEVLELMRRFEHLILALGEFLRKKRARGLE